MSVECCSAAASVVVCSGLLEAGRMGLQQAGRLGQRFRRFLLSQSMDDLARRAGSASASRAMARWSGEC